MSDDKEITDNIITKCPICGGLTDKPLTKDNKFGECCTVCDKFFSEKIKEKDYKLT